MNRSLNTLSTILTFTVAACLATLGACADPGSACAPDDTECLSAVCGDGDIAGQEQCDDGNTTNGDGCDSFCREVPVTCGNEVVDEAAGEQCDTGTETATCDGNCTLVACGDGWRNTLVEGCDDGNTTAGDGCSAQCTIELPSACGDGIVQTQLGEQCDDGNTASNDGCDSTCHLENAGACGIRAIGCGMPGQNGTTASTAATDVIDAYSCLVDQDKSGPEVVYEWVADRSGTVSVYLEGTSTLDVIITEVLPACGPGTCIMAGRAGATFTAVSGTRYLVIVDSDPGTTAPYQVGMSCS